MHTIDRFRWFYGKDIVRVRVDSIGNELFDQVIDDHIAGAVSFGESYKSSQFSLRWSPHQENDYVFDVVGTDGMVKVLGFDRAYLLRGEEALEIFCHDPAADFPQRHEPGIRAELVAFAEFLRSGEHTKHVDDCIKAQEVIDCFYPRP